MKDDFESLLSRVSELVGESLDASGFVGSYPGRGYFEVLSEGKKKNVKLNRRNAAEEFAKGTDTSKLENVLYTLWRLSEGGSSEERVLREARHWLILEPEEDRCAKLWDAAADHVMRRWRLSRL